MYFFLSGISHWSLARSGYNSVNSDFQQTDSEQKSVMAAIVPDAPLATDAGAEVELPPATNAAFSLFVFRFFS